MLKKILHVRILVAIPDREQLCVCVCVCVCGCYARDTALRYPLFFVSRETALFCQAILRVLTKKHGHGCKRYTLYSVQSSDVWLYPKLRVSDTTTYACGWTHACGCIHCLYFYAPSALAVRMCSVMYGIRQCNRFFFRRRD